MFPVNNVNFGCWRASVRQYYLFWVHCFSYTCLWGWKRLICPITSFIFSKHSHSLSTLTSSVRRRVWGQCRWSEELIPTRHNPAKLKYHENHLKDCRHQGDLQKDQVQWWISRERTEAKAAAFFRQGEPILVFNMWVWNRKACTKQRHLPIMQLKRYAPVWMPVAHFFWSSSAACRDRAAPTAVYSTWSAGDCLSVI